MRCLHAVCKSEVIKWNKHVEVIINIKDKLYLLSCKYFSCWRKIPFVLIFFVVIHMYIFSIHVRMLSRHVSWEGGGEVHDLFTMRQCDTTVVALYGWLGICSRFNFPFTEISWHVLGYFLFASKFRSQHGNVNSSILRASVKKWWHWRIFFALQPNKWNGRVLNWKWYHFVEFVKWIHWNYEA